MIDNSYHSLLLCCVVYRVGRRGGLLRGSLGRISPLYFSLKMMRKIKCAVDSFSLLRTLSHHRKTADKQWKDGISSETESMKTSVKEPTRNVLRQESFPL